MKGTELKQILTSYLPNKLAYDWDNVGLQIGDFNKDVHTILLTLDVTPEVVAEAIKKNVDVIISHHPLIFRPLKQIITSAPQGKMIQQLIKNEITLFVAHTNFDVHKDGMNQILADMLSLQDQKILDYTTEELGLGKYGTVKETPMKEYIEHVKEVFGVSKARFIGTLDTFVNTVAISGGSGSSNIMPAYHKNVDLYITGDITYHYALDALSMGLNILDLGHNIEKHFVKELKQNLISNGVTASILLSEIDTNPYTFV